MATNRGIMNEICLYRKMIDTDCDTILNVEESEAGRVNARGTKTFVKIVVKHLRVINKVLDDNLVAEIEDSRYKMAACDPNYFRELARKVDKYIDQNFYGSSCIFFILKMNAKYEKSYAPIRQFIKLVEQLLQRYKFIADLCRRHADRLSDLIIKHKVSIKNEVICDVMLFVIQTAHGVVYNIFDMDYTSRLKEMYGED